ncbi:hypothetical protein Tco_0307256 [Tanacetum coccineum]
MGNTNEETNDAGLTSILVHQCCENDLRIMEVSFTQESLPDSMPKKTNSKGCTSSEIILSRKVFPDNLSTYSIRTSTAKGDLEIMWKLLMQGSGRTLQQRKEIRLLSTKRFRAIGKRVTCMNTLSTLSQKPNEPPAKKTLKKQGAVYNSIVDPWPIFLITQPVQNSPNSRTYARCMMVTLLFLKLHIRDKLQVMLVQQVLRGKKGDMLQLQEEQGHVAMAVF